MHQSTVPLPLQQRCQPETRIDVCSRVRSASVCAARVRLAPNSNPLLSMFFRRLLNRLQMAPRISELEETNRRTTQVANPAKTEAQLGYPPRGESVGSGFVHVRP